MSATVIGYRLLWEGKLKKKVGLDSGSGTDVKDKTIIKISFVFLGSVAISVLSL